MLATFLGPFGTYNSFDPWKLFVFWTLDFLFAAICAHLALAAIFSIDQLRGVPWPIRMLGAVMIAAIPITVLIFEIHGILNPGAPISPFLVIWSEVTVVTMLVALTEFVLWPMLETRAAPSGHAADGITATMHGDAFDGIAFATQNGAVEGSSKLPCSSIRPKLLDHLGAAHQGASVVSLSMQDHYVEVTTTAGNELILMRLGDAIDLLDGIKGARIHRSHWAAAAFASEIRRNGRRHDLIMDGGRILPISASRIEAARGLLSTRAAARARRENSPHMLG